jgi:hypothetical protein
MSTSTVNIPDVRYGVTTDYDYSAERKRQYLDVWSGPWMHDHEGRAVSRPRGFAITTNNGAKVYIDCPSPRTDDNYQQVDAAISAALNRHHHHQRLAATLQGIDGASIV